MNRNHVLCVAIPTIGAMYITYVIVTKADGLVFGTAVSAVGALAGYLFSKGSTVYKKSK